MKNQNLLAKKGPHYEKKNYFLDYDMYYDNDNHTTDSSGCIKRTVKSYVDNINTLIADLTFDGRTGSFAISVTGQNGVTNITVTVSLYWKNSSGVWQDTTRSWSCDVDQMTLGASDSFTGVAGREYKIVVNGTVTKGGYTESFSKSATAVCPGT